MTVQANSGSACFPVHLGWLTLRIARASLRNFTPIAQVNRVETTRKIRVVMARTNRER